MTWNIDFPTTAIFDRDISDTSGMDIFLLSPAEARAIRGGAPVPDAPQTWDEGDEGDEANEGNETDEGDE